MADRGRRYSQLATLALVVAVLSFTAAIAAGLGTRLELWDFGTGFTILTWAATGGFGSLVLALAATYLTRPRTRRRGFVVAAVALLIATITAGVPLSWGWVARHAPRIHDISTDTANPPSFVAILTQRANAPNPATYGGPEVAAQQHAAYPDIQPLLLRMPPARAFELTLDVARDLGWTIVDADPAAGRIEASDRTFWFGFTDDAVVRITPSAEGGARVDVRSVSRVGLGDVGTNARRVRSFLEKLAARAS